MDGISIRRGGEIDADACAALHRRVFTEQPPPWSRDSFASMANDPDFGVASAFAEDGALVGFAVWRRVVDEAELLTICVDPDRRRCGIGASLLAVVVEDAVNCRCVALHLEVADNNVAAQALYRRYGFEAVGRRPRYYRMGSKRRLDALILSKTLIDRK